MSLHLSVASPRAQQFMHVTVTHVTVLQLLPSLGQFLATFHILLDKFCYLGGLLSVDGDADAAVGAWIQTGWNKFRQLVPVLTNKDVSLI